MREAPLATAGTVTARKTLKSNFGSLELFATRNRYSSFEPQIIPKRSTKSAIFEDAICPYSVYFTRLIRVNVSASLISEAVYPVVWLDRLVVKVHQASQVWI